MRRAPAFVIGFRGCDRAVGERVLANEEHLKPSENDYDWLGTGIYFWENNALRAMDWAHFAKENPKVVAAKIADPFVVGAIIDLGYCLDLLEAESIRTVARDYLRLKDAYKTGDIALPRNKKNGE